MTSSSHTPTTPIEIEKAYEQIGLTKNFCTIPFSTLHIEPDGLIGSCRQKGAEYFIGNIFENSIEEIWNGPAIKEWRRQFLTAQPTNCHTDIKHKSCNLCPQYNRFYKDISPSETVSYMPLRIAFNLNGKCNLECQMCHIWQKPNGLYDSIPFWQNLDKLIVNLQEVELLSGEPFIQKDTYRLIDFISARKPHCQWVITTNANWKLNQHIKSFLDKIEFRNLIVSLDSLDPEIYPKIRRKGHLKMALKTIDDLIFYDGERKQKGLSTLDIRINFLIQKDNWKELEAIFEFEKEKGISAFRTFLYVPEEHSLLSLPKEKIVEILNYYLENLSTESFKKSMRVILPLLEKIDNIDRALFLSRASDKLYDKSNILIQNT